MRDRDIFIKIKGPLLIAFSDKEHSRSFKMFFGPKLSPYKSTYLFSMGIYFLSHLYLFMKLLTYQIKFELVALHILREIIRREQK